MITNVFKHPFICLLATSVKLPSHLFLSHFTCLFYLFVLKHSCIIMWYYSSNNSNIWYSKRSKSVFFSFFSFLSADFYSVWLISLYVWNIWLWVEPMKICRAETWGCFLSEMIWVFSCYWISIYNSFGIFWVLSMTLI